MARVSKKGSIPIPREIRERYGIHPGDKVQFVDFDGMIRLIPIPKDPIAAARGMLKGGPSLRKALLEERREELEREERKIERRQAEPED